MTDAAHADPLAASKGRLSALGWFNRLMAAREFQKWAAKSFLTRRIVRREGEAMFDLLAGFCHSQVLSALVQLEIPQKLMGGPMDGQALAVQARMPVERMQILLRAGVALGVLKSRRKGRYGLSRTGAALVGVPGLSQMIAHHDVLYRDLSDPVAFFRGEVETELAGFWPYVFGGNLEPEVAATYSDLMAQSQLLVADDTLAAVDLSGVTRLVDIGGGSGAFLAAVGAVYKDIELTLFDLPEVAPSAAERFEAVGLTSRTRIIGGSFRDCALPQGADAISLVRVLYDHSDETVTALLAHCHAALPSGGRLIISEPMTGGAQPTRAGDAYFALYTLAMRTGRTRSAAEIAQLCQTAGFDAVKAAPSRRPFVTSCIEARKP